jgi:tetratricopeptide (TPR) repeat protein
MPSMRFCPQCGTPVVPGAKFCIECGSALAGSAATAAIPSSRPAPTGETGGLAPASSGAALHPVTPAFAGVFAGMLILGLAAAAILAHRLPPDRRNSAAAVTGPEAPANLPPGHPQVVQLPAEARKLIEQIQANAEGAPNDIAAWDRLGDVAERAAVFDPSYAATAERAYGHVLKLDPDNLDALRGIGNIDYDRHHYDEAIAAYEHYLDRKPDDPRVRTDLGTMYLSSGNPDLAAVEYKKVLVSHPKFFEAYFNLGVASAEQDNKPASRDYFQKARALAPDDQTRGEIDKMLATVGGPDGGPLASATSANTPAGGASFPEAFEQMMRALPIAGSKVHAVQWTRKDRARVLMDDFPMDQMPPFAAARFLDDLKSGTRDVMNSHHVKGPFTVDIADAASQRVMQSVTVEASSATSAPAGEIASSTSGSDAPAPPPSATFQQAVDAMMRNLPVAGPKVASVQWPSSSRAKVMMDNFPMDAMPPFARDKLIADIRAGLDRAKAAHQVTATVTVDIADAQSGRVMDSVSE